MEAKKILCSVVAACLCAGTVGLVAHRAVCRDHTSLEQVMAECERIDETERELRQKYKQAAPVKKVVPKKSGLPWKISNAVPLTAELQKYTQEICEKHEVSYPLVLAVMQTESSFKHNAKNGHSYGLMQVHSCNAKWLREQYGIKDIRNSKDNIKAGIIMLSLLHKKYGNIHSVLTCYNYGQEGAWRHVFRHGKVKCGYSQKVARRINEWAIKLR